MHFLNLETIWDLAEATGKSLPTGGVWSNWTSKLKVWSNQIAIVRSLLYWNIPARQSNSSMYFPHHINLYINIIVKQTNILFQHLVDPVNFIVDRSILSLYINCICSHSTNRHQQFPPFKLAAVNLRDPGVQNMYLNFQGKGLNIMGHLTRQINQFGIYKGQRFKCKIDEQSTSTMRNFSDL